VYGLPGPKTQTPIGYHLTIVSNEVYETVDEMGNARMVNEGEAVYTKYFDIDKELLVELSAGNVDLENNIGYTVTCTVSMNSGLTVTSTYDFKVAWTDELYVPDAEIGIDPDTVSAYIRPYCQEIKMDFYKVDYDATSNAYVKTTEKIEFVEGGLFEDQYTTTGEEVLSGLLEDGETEIYYCEIQSDEVKLIEGVTLSVYRREFDGSFTEIATGLNNSKNTYVTDPHPALDYARYRIVAITDATGAVSFYDVPGYPVNEKAVVIQWDEAWSTFYTSEEAELEQPPWAGSLIKLPYNVDVSDKYKFCVWDFNNAFDNYQEQAIDHETFLLHESLWFNMIIKDKDFTERVIKRYHELRKTYFSDDYLNNYIDETIAYLGDAIDRNFEKWGYTFESDHNLLYPTTRNLRSYDEAVAQLKGYIASRGAWMDENIDVLRQYSANSKAKLAKEHTR
jgi:hypothetical protein